MTQSPQNCVAASNEQIKPTWAYKHFNKKDDIKNMTILVKDFNVVSITNLQSNLEILQNFS